MNRFSQGWREFARKFDLVITGENVVITNREGGGKCRGQASDLQRMAKIRGLIRPDVAPDRTWRIFDAMIDQFNI